MFLLVLSLLGFWIFIQFVVGFFFVHFFFSLSVVGFLQEVDVNLVITDYCMPEMTGYDLLKKIKVFCLILLLIPFMFCTARQMFVEMPLKGNFPF